MDDPLGLELRIFHFAPDAIHDISIIVIPSITIRHDALLGRQLPLGFELVPRVERILYSMFGPP